MGLIPSLLRESWLNHGETLISAGWVYNVVLHMNNRFLVRLEFHQKVGLYVDCA